MMKEKKSLKIFIALIVIILIVATSILGVVINKIKDESNNDQKNDITISEKAKEQALNSEFSLKFLKLENNKQNMIYSPLSIKYGLIMLNEGANGNTKIQIESLIGNESLTKYNNIDNVLSLANGVYIRDTFSQNINEDYKKTLTEKYNAEIKYDSFKNANNINNWIENKTLRIIKNMLSNETVQNPETVMLLINALAIDMEWESKFDAKDTKGNNFYLQNGNIITATTMHQRTSSDSVSYYKTDDVTALIMDLDEYNSTQLEFAAIMPEENLSNYIEKFTIDDFNNIINNSKLASETRKGVNIYIPRFEFDYDLHLKNDLMNLGITDAFNSQLADFSKISSEKLYASDALHKANIEFTEKGVKAAAVTVIYMTLGEAIETEKPIEIKIDKPFLFLIRDKNTGEIWFVGTVYEPNIWENDKASYEYK